jgi:4-hydroxyphenylpyruvate dioxygenase/4-hydroxymandelate synthase
MNFLNFDHIELYVEELEPSALFYISTLGFRVVAEAGPETGLQGLRSLVLQQGGLVLRLTSPLEQGDESVAGFLERHGDGVRDIALRTPDAVAAFREAVRRGARPVREPEVFMKGGSRVIRATVASVGDLMHSFVQREGPEAELLPGLFQPTNRFPLPVMAPFTALDHVALCLEQGTLERTVRFFEDVLGFRQSHEEDIRTEYSGMNSRVVQTPNGRVCFPMMEPVPGMRRGQIDDFLERNGGAGVQHMALLTQDISHTLRLLQSRDMKVLDVPAAYYEVLESRVGPLEQGVASLREQNVLVDRDDSGLLLQAFCRSTHPRRTFFLEVIERQQASGFGGANIRALFEAVEREHARR